MAQLARIQVAMSGAGLVGPGVMTFYGTTTGSGLVAATKAFVTAIATPTPNGVSFVVPDGGDLIEDTTGVIAGSWNEGGGATITSQNSTGLVLGLGARIEWRTGTVVAGRHLRGRTFIVPLAKGAYGDDGRVSPGYVSSLQTAANNFLSATAGNLVIWSRPKPARTGKKGPLPAQVGAHGAITSASVPTVPTALRSRRT